MIHVFRSEVFEDEYVEKIKNDSDYWDYPLEELPFLLEERTGEFFMLIDNRLYELNLEHIELTTNEELEQYLKD